jgi:hypothetical protein
MTFARRLAHVENVPQQDSAQNAFNKLARTFAAQVSALKDYRSRGEQRMVVQHVNVAEGGQAIVGNVSSPAAGLGVQEKEDVRPRCFWICTGRRQDQWISMATTSWRVSGGSPRKHYRAAELSDRRGSGLSCAAIRRARQERGQWQIMLPDARPRPSRPAGNHWGSSVSKAEEGLDMRRASR